MFLIPQTIHHITWIKQNRLDTATYYPQAVIKDKQSDTVLDTLTLASLGSDRYGVNWNVIQDSTGSGREIAIIITVYEDSGHTNISGIYGSWETDYLIFDISQRVSGGGGGGSILDLNDIRKIIKEEIETIPKTEIDLKEVLGEIGEVKSGVKEKIRQIFNLEQKTESLSNLEKEIVKTIKELTKENDRKTNEAEKRIDQTVNTFNKRIDNISDEIKTISSEEIQNIKSEVNNGAKTIMNVFKEETDNAENNLKQKIFKQMTITLDSQPNKKDDRKKRLLNYAQK